MTNGNEGAFASPASAIESELRGYIERCGSAGLTKREYFAAIALEGLLANPDCVAPYTAVAQGAVTAAEALIAELNKEEQTNG